jgi:beta-lactam-binding protein with PASTA domain
LKNAKLKVGIITPPVAPEQSLVVKQTPRAGTEVDEGTSIDLEVKVPPDNQTKAKKKSVARGVSKKTKSKASRSKRAKMKQDSSSA